MIDTAPFRGRVIAMWARHHFTVGQGNRTDKPPPRHRAEGSERPSAADAVVRGQQGADCKSYLRSEKPNSLLRFTKPLDGSSALATPHKCKQGNIPTGEYRVLHRCLLSHIRKDRR